MALHPLAFNMGVELRQPLFIGMHAMRGLALVEAIGGQHAGHFADVPFDRMQPVTTIGDMRGADILGSGQQICFVAGNKGTQRNFERAGADIDIIIAARRGVQVDAVHADADAIRVMHRAAIAAHRKRQILLDSDALQTVMADFASSSKQKWMAKKRSLPQENIQANNGISTGMAYCFQAQHRKRTGRLHTSRTFNSC